MPPRHCSATFRKRCSASGHRWRAKAAWLEEMQARMLAGVDEFARRAAQADDITLLLLRYCGTANPRAGRDKLT